MAEQEQSVEPRFLLVKRGLYYRPDSRGYTGKKSEAGRYHENERCQLEGVDAIHEDDAGEYAPACWMETKLADKDARIAELEAQLSTPTPDAVNADKALMPEAAVAYLWERPDFGRKVLTWPDDAVPIGWNCTPLYAHPATPTPVEEPEKGATGQLAAIIACMDEMLADPKLDALAFDKDDSRIIRAALAATNAGQVEALAFAAQVEAELAERAPTYSIRSIEREHLDRAILALSGLRRVLANGDAS